MSVKATERSMHVSLYMRGPLSRGCTMLGFCWHVLTGLRAPWSLLWGGGGEAKTPQRAPLRSWPHIRLNECSIRFWLFLTGLRAPWLLGEGCYVQTGCAITASVLLTLPFHLLRNQRPLNSGGRQALGASLQPGSPLRSWPPMPLNLILRFVCP